MKRAKQQSAHGRSVGSPVPVAAHSRPAGALLAATLFAAISAGFASDALAQGPPSPLPISRWR